MRLAEATSRDSSPVGTAPANTAAKRTLDSATAQFASVLSATRQSSPRVMDVLLPGPSADSAQQVEPAGRLEAARGKRAESSRSKRSQAEPAGKPGRVEQLQSLQRERRRAEIASDEASMPGDAAADHVNPVSAHRDGQMVSTFAQSGSAPDVVGSGIVSSPTVTAEGTVGGPIAGSVTGAANGSAATAAAPAGPGGTAGEGSAGTHASQAVGSATLTPVKNAGQSVASGQETASHAAARTVTPLRSNGSAGEFQNLLAGLGRQRGAEPTNLSGVKIAGLMTANKSPAEKPVELESAESVRDLARIVRSQIGSRKSSMTLAMSPPELGRLRIEVRMEENTLALRFETDTQGGREMLQGKLHELKAALERQGVQVDRVEVEFVQPAPSAGAEREWSGQPQSDGQWQAPADDGHLAGHAGQSFQQRREAPMDGSLTGEERTSGTVAVAALSHAIWADGGVDVIA